MYILHSHTSYFDCIQRTNMIDALLDKYFRSRHIINHGIKHLSVLIYRHRHTIRLTFHNTSHENATQDDCRSSHSSYDCDFLVLCEVAVAYCWRFKLEMECGRGEEVEGSKGMENMRQNRRHTVTGSKEQVVKPSLVSCG